jgi:hypothetical protein
MTAHWLIEARVVDTNPRLDAGEVTKKMRYGKRRWRKILHRFFGTC